MNTIAAYLGSGTNILNFLYKICADDDIWAAVGDK